MLSCVTVAMLCLLFGCLMLTDYSFGSKLKATVLNVKEKELIVQAGQPIHLSCSGDQTLSLKFPAASRRENKRFHITENACQGSPNMMCQRNLTLYNAQITDTGFYSCQYMYLKSSKNWSTIYIYVTDGNSAFVDMQNGEPGIITINNGDRLVIPCRVTSPNVTVTLKQHHGNVLSKPGDKSVVWDSRKGFIIRKPSYVFFGLLDCEAKVNGVVRTVNYFTNRHYSTIYSIDLSTPSNFSVLRYKRLSITCSVITDLNSRAEIHWTYPSLKFGNIASIIKRISFSNSKAVTSSTLFIHKVHNIDQGLYTCTAKNGPVTKTNSTKVRVHAAPYIKAKPRKAGVLEAVVGQMSFRIGVKVRAFPPPEITWWKNNLLAADKCARYIINGSTLTIKDVETEDAGEYTVVLSLKRWNLTKNITMTLQVNAKPHIYEKSLSIQEPYPHVLGSRQTLTCTVYAVPPSTIGWTWHPCPENYSRARCDFHPEQAIPVIVGKNSSGMGNKVHSMTERTRNIEGKNKTQSVLVIDNSITSGVYSCIASNKVGTERRDINFFVTDVPNGFHISVDKVPNEGENMTLTCSVNKYLYTNISWILRRKVGNHTISHSISKHRSSTTRAYSTILTTTVHNITQAHSGVYECRAMNAYSGDIISQSKEIVIRGDPCGRKTNNSRTTKQRRKNCSTDISGVH